MMEESGRATRRQQPNLSAKMKVLTERRVRLCMRTLASCMLRRLNREKA